MDSLQELSLIASLPPGFLEKYVLQVIERLDSEFLTSNHKIITKLIESKTNIYTVVVSNSHYNDTIVIRELRIEDVADILLYTLDGWAGDELDYHTLNNILNYLEQYLAIDNCESLSKNPNIRRIFNDFRKNLIERTNLERLVGSGFLFTNNKGQIKIKIMKTQQDFDHFLEHEYNTGSKINIMNGKDSIAYALGGWISGNKYF